MRAAQDPLSDESKKRWMRLVNMPESAINVDVTWSQCRAYARQIIDRLSESLGDKTTQNLQLSAENKRLRELLERGISSFGEASEYALWLDESRAALEGKE